MIFIVYEKQNKNAKKVKHRKPKRGSVFSSRKLVMRSKAVKSCEDISDTISVPTGRTSGRDLLILSENRNLKATKNVLIEQTNKKKRKGEENKSSDNYGSMGKRTKIERAKISYVLK